MNVLKLFCGLAIALVAITTLQGCGTMMVDRYGNVVGYEPAVVVQPTVIYRQPVYVEPYYPPRRTIIVQRRYYPFAGGRRPIFDDRGHRHHHHRHNRRDRRDRRYH